MNRACKWEDPEESFYGMEETQDVNEMHMFLFKDE